MLAGVGKRMKKLDKRWLLFLVLVLMLAVGLPYLSLNQEASTTTSVEEGVNVQTMAIALVNEDEGASFNGDTLTFGDAFVRSLDNNDEHNWFVVSRGVAESGLNQNTYDMMIVIPNDFSDKALSIDSESPEQVVLNYRINASDDDGYVKAEAEKTASTILNEFNRRIIDVYFASIIGNLQDAQDNIGEIVDKQTQHTSAFNNNINNPLSNYTNQFGMIKDNTQVSRDGFSGFEDLLQDFEGRLADGFNQNQGYLSELDGFASVKDENNAELLGFSDALLQFNILLNNPDAEQNLEQLQRMNDLINYQFEIKDRNEQNIALQTALLTWRLNDSVEGVTTTNKMVEDRLAGLEQEVESKISKIFNGIWEEQEEFLVGLFKAQDEIVRETIYEQISDLPSLNEEDFKSVGLPEETVKEILNVIAVTDIFNEDLANITGEDTYLPKYVKNLIKHLHETGVTITDTVWIPTNEKEGQEFTLNIPGEYALTKLELQFPGEGIEDYTERYNNGDGKLNLKPNIEGNFKINVSLKLRDRNNKIDVFDPIKLGWKLKHIYIEEEEIDVPSEDGSNNDNGNGEEESGGDNENIEAEGFGDDTENIEVEESSNDIESTEVEESSENNENVEEEVTDGDDGGGNVSTTKIKKLKVFNNSISHEMIEPVHKMDNATTGLVQMVTKTVSPYQKLYSTFDKYLGSTVMDMETEKLKREIGKESFDLKEFAEGNSLYKFFNDPNINDLITESMVSKVVSNIYNDINKPLEILKGRINSHQEQIDTAREDAEILAEEVITSAEQARVLNENLGEVLEQVTNWRTHSMALLEIHGKIEANDGEERAAVMTLNNEFQPLLSNSQSIAEQAQGNLSSADTVYQTLDTIDNQADTIEQSGENLVTQAGQLSSDMTEKMVEDQEFATNFTDVLSNSRVGERQNENLYNFLSNPVQTSNVGSMTSGSNFTPYFLVLTTFIVVLFTAYVISTLQQKRAGTDQFTHEKSLMGTNLPITIITAGIGALEGIAIGVISSNLLGISDGNMILWTVLITTLIIGMLLVATYLLRQLKMLGMFVLVIVMSMYLFLTNAFGAGIDGLGYLRDYSPLQYVEGLLLQAVTGNANYLLAMLVIGGLILIGVLANLFVINRDGKGDLEDEGSKKAS